MKNPKIEELNLKESESSKDEDYEDISDEDSEEEKIPSKFKKMKPSFIHFKDRNGKWNDIEPVPQFKESIPIAQIEYNPEFLEVLDYFRAILNKNEISDRAFELTTEVVSINPGSYMAWHYRRKCIDTLGLSLEGELNFLNQHGPAMHKIYQYWHHRRLIAQAYNKFHEDEMKFLKKMFRQDDKNYHMWTYRMWICQTYNLWESELSYINRQIEFHPTNNSLWSYRYFLLINTSTFNQNFVKSQLKYAFKYISENALNECAWVFLKGLFYFDPIGNKNPNIKKVFIGEYSGVKSFCENIISQDWNRFALGFLVDIESSNKNKVHLMKAINYCKILANKADIIRKNYWMWKSKRFVEELQIIVHVPSKDSESQNTQEKKA